MSNYYRIYRAAVDHDGVCLGTRTATARTLADALRAAANPRNHGPEGAAIVTGRGRVIYTAEEYSRAYERAGIPR